MLTDRTIHTGHKTISIRNRGGGLTFDWSEGSEERQVLEGSGVESHNGGSEGRKKQQVPCRYPHQHQDCNDVTG